MQYRFVHHWNYALDEEEHEILEAAVSLAAQERDQDFLYKVASFIAQHAKVKYVLIGVLRQQGKTVSTCAFLKDGERLENMTYPLQHTPCDAVLTQQFCYYPERVWENFPKDKDLQELRIESYLGSIFMAEENEPMGLIALMDEKPIENAAFAEHLILVLSPAIEEELIRLKSCT